MSSTRRRRWAALVAGVATALAAASPGTATTRTDPTSRGVRVVCDQVGETTVTVTGHPSQGRVRLVRGPLRQVGEPGWRGADARGRAVDRRATGQGVTCTSWPGQLDGTLTVTAQLTEALPATTGPTTTPASKSLFDFPFQADVAAYLASRPGSAAVAFRNLEDQTLYRYSKDRSSYYTASIVKVEIMMGVMLKAQDAGRPLSDWEKAQIRPMIRYSDNTTASTLFRYIGGRAGLDRVSARLGLTGTTSYPVEGYWGLTTTNPTDQTRLLRHLSRPTGKIAYSYRAWGLMQMRAVASDQDWGVTAGPPAGTVAVKNGWLPYQGVYHANSIGYSREDSPDYAIAVLTARDNGTLTGQITTIEGISKLLWSRRAEL